MSQPNRLVRPILIVVAIALVALLLSRLGGSGPERSASLPAPSTNPTPAPRPRTSRAVAERPGPLRLPSGEIAVDETRRAGAFSGRVVEARTGAPIAGATLTFDQEGVARAVTSGADGAFLFEPPAPGVYALAMVTAKGFHPFAPAWGESPITLIARAGEVVRGLTITLEPERRYEGVVLTPAGEPAPKAEVRILEAPGGEASAGGRFVADDTGAFTFSAPDDALLEATHPDHAPARARLDMRAQASGRVTLRLRPKGEAIVLASITGVVVDAAGAPVPFAGVSARFHRDIVRDDDLHPGASATTDERGAFTLEGLDPGTYELTAREGARIARAEGVAAGAEGVTLRLTATGRIRGTVRGGSTGTPVASFSVVAARHRGPLEREYSASTSFFDATGAYEIGDLLPGTYAVTAAALGHAPSATVDVTVPAGGEATADLVLRAGGRLHGIVVEDDTEEPIQGARVTIEGQLGAGAGPVPVVADATTDASGRFSLLGLAEGARSVTATAPGHHGRVLSGLVVTEGGEIGPVRISLAKLKDGEEARMELTGIGAVLGPKGDALVIGQVLPGGGAANAGLGPGDAIVAIDGAPIVEIGFEAAVERIRGPEGSLVRLSVRRGGTGEATDIAVRRTRIRG
ncbi:carboxypeptidase regulatory-like domain-containing protein [Polyangium sp. 15x6]|uniref:carboxypeptidase regulatory-like domain-containing protein n=1 Tax=Polyangium sp. 15x6 TaxID=3042687 RepID=UPI00249BBA68|nr:carboxypeptidase regulatory-like domain-containing protein [Polyangium sp. 15x6]MDI3292116.1 carboxypeptidase regulatory-like domain-containing protein [Polyangium sp. 15x6]